MTSKPWTALLTIAAICIALGISTFESALTFTLGTSWWVAWACQVLPQSVRTCLLWMTGCFITMRHGSITWATRIVPIGVFVLLLASDATASYMNLQGQRISIIVAAVGEFTTLVLASACALVFSNLLNVSLRQVSCTEEIAPLRFRIQTILIVTTCIAVFLAFQNWINNHYSIVSGSSDELRAFYLLTYVLHFICNGFAFFGLIWLVASNKRRWLGIVGFLVWPAAPISQICLLLSPAIQEQLPLGVASAFLALLTAYYVTVLLGILLTIPIFRLFGISFESAISRSLCLSYVYPMNCLTGSQRRKLT